MKFLLAILVASLTTITAQAQDRPPIIEERHSFADGPRVTVYANSRPTAAPLLYYPPQQPMYAAPKMMSQPAFAPVMQYQQAMPASSWPATSSRMSMPQLRAAANC